MDQDMVQIYKVMSTNHKCDVCGVAIDEANWYSKVCYAGLWYNIHDNQACLELLKYRLGLPYDRYFTSISPG